MFKNQFFGHTFAWFDENYYLYQNERRTRKLFNRNNKRGLPPKHANVSVIVTLKFCNGKKKNLLVPSDEVWFDGNFVISQ